MKIHIRRPFSNARPFRKSTFCGLYIGNPNTYYPVINSNFVSIENKSQYCKTCLKLSGKDKE